MSFKNAVFSPIETLGEGIVLVWGRFRINGTTHPDNLKGPITSAVRNEAGEFTFTTSDQVGKAHCLGGFANPNITADDVDLYARVDAAAMQSAGTFKVFTMTGATQTDPTDDTDIIVCLVCSKNDRYF